MEQLIHYVWKHKLFPLTGLKTTDGQEVEVIDTGLHNHNAGPDFFNAKVKIGGTLWVGNVEIHDRASDWFLHRHDRDPNYNNVILHVAGSIDVDVKTRRGDYPPQMRLQVPTAVREHYEETGVLELEVGVGIENRIIPDLCTACFRLLYAESPDAWDILRGIIVREIAAVHTEVDIQHTGDSEPYEEVAVGIEERDRKNVIFA